MAQAPFLCDAVQIEPGSNQTLLIERDAGTGALKFRDAVTTGGLLLYQLAGLRAIGNVRVVGTSGAGAQYTTIQAAMDTVPASASPTNPFLVLVMPGLYTETVNIVRDGVHLIGIGQPTLRSVLEATPDALGADHTLILSSQLGTTPRFCLIQGFKITNAHNNKACIRVAGAAASTLLGEGYGLQIRDCVLEANSAGGNYTLWGTTAGDVYAWGTTFGGSQVLSQALAQEMNLIALTGCALQGGLTYRFDTALDQPDSPVGLLRLWNCPDMASETALVPALSIDCDGGGSSQVQSCTMGASHRVQYSGDQSHSVHSSQLGVLSIQETATVTTGATKHAGVLAPNATAVLDEDVRQGSVVLAAATGDVTFDVPFSDGGFYVSLELSSRPAGDESPWVTLKAATGFRINFQTAQAMEVFWTATRQ